MIAKNKIDQFTCAKIDNPVKCRQIISAYIVDIIRELWINLKILRFYIYFAIILDLISMELVYI